MTATTRTASAGVWEPDTGVFNLTPSAAVLGDLDDFIYSYSGQEWHVSER